MLGLLNLSRFSAGVIAVLVGYTSSAAIIFQAADAAGATPEQISSWLWALGLGMGLTCIGLSLKYRAPILTAWSTPGAALLVTSLEGVSMNEAIGVFLFCSVLITLSALTGVFDKLMRFIPTSLATAMLAGVLFQFGLNMFSALEDQLLLVGVMLSTYLLMKQLLPRYVIPLTLMTGIALAGYQDTLHFEHLHWQITTPVLMLPEFSLQSLIGVGIPLFIVSMTSQYMPGLAVLRANGYKTPASPLIGWTGFTGAVLAPFGGFSINLAAITAAICASEEADPDPKKRYFASIWAGIFYCLTGIFGATVAAAFDAFPTALIVAIAGLALLGTIGNSLAASLVNESEREEALLTFMVTASGLTLLGVGAAFWGVVLGLAFHNLKRLAR